MFGSIQEEIMRRREQREHIFKLLFMTEFNSQEEMTEQLSLYFDIGESGRKIRNISAENI